MSFSVLLLMIGNIEERSKAPPEVRNGIMIVRAKSATEKTREQSLGGLGKACIQEGGAVRSPENSEVV